LSDSEIRRTWRYYIYFLNIWFILLRFLFLFFYRCLSCRRSRKRVQIKRIAQSQSGKQLQCFIAVVFRFASKKPRSHIGVIKQVARLFVHPVLLRLKQAVDVWAEGEL
jgi:hypothetical protein